MPYTNPWSDSIPPGSAQAHTIDDQIRQLRLDIKERMDTILDTGKKWEDDPIGLPAVLSTTAGRVKVVRDVAFDISTNVKTVIPWAAELYQTPAGMHDTGTNPERITIPAAVGAGKLWHVAAELKITAIDVFGQISHHIVAQMFHFTGIGPTLISEDRFTVAPNGQPDDVGLFHLSANVATDVGTSAYFYVAITDPQGSQLDQIRLWGADAEGYHCWFEAFAI